MIVNNYTNELREHKETDMSFHARLCHLVFVRRFKERFPYTEKLVFPYFIVDEDDRNACSDKTRQSFIDDYKSTYTTIIKLDEQLNSGAGIKTWKRTSFGGDQVIELDFHDVSIGVHTLSIQCIDKYGVGSPTQYFKCMIEDPNAEPVVIDLDTIGSFDGYFNYSESTDENDLAYLNSNEGNTLTNHSSKYEAPDKYVVKRTIVAGYHVRKVYNQSGDTLERIAITVDPAGTSGLVSDTGYIYRYDVRNWKTYIHPLTGKRYEGRGIKREKISGTYELVFVHNGVPMSNYISYNPAVLDATDTEIRNIAARNKIALTRLMEAAQAYAGKSKCILKLPHKSHIVTDFHEVGDDGTVIDVYDDVKKKYVGGTYILFPDRFVLDLNGSTISVLQVNNILFAVVAALSNNFDTIIKNGKIYGNYKYFDKAYAPNMSTEWTGNTAIWGSEFCSFDNCELAYCLGYDAGIEDNTDYKDRDFRVNYPAHSMPYNGVGYIDYNGDQHVTASVNKFSDPNFDSILKSQTIVMRTTDGGDYKGVHLGTVDVLATSRLLAPPNGNAKRLPFRMPGEYLWGDMMDLARGDGPSRGFYSKLENRECFVHFYDENRSFIKTAKVRDTGPILLPENAEFIGYSCFGSNDPNSTSPTLSRYDSTNKRCYGQPFAQGSRRSWCSGYRDCIIHDNRSSLFDNKHTNQCFADGCYMYSIAAERRLEDGGFSNQTLFADIEESVLNDNFFVHNCENIYGRAGFNTHHSYNICFSDTRNINILLNKNVYGAYVNGHYGLLREYFGFSAPRKYHEISNNIITRLNFGWEFSFQHTDGDGRLYISDSTIFMATTVNGADKDGRYTKLFTKDCNIVENKLKKNNN